MLPAMPMAAMFLGISWPCACMPPRRARAFIIDCGWPISWAAPRSARNSRWRENQATMMPASTPNRMSSTIVVA